MLRSVGGKTLKIWIAVLSALLALCVVALIVTGVKNGQRQDSGTVELPANMVTSGGTGESAGMNAPGATLIQPGTDGKEVNTPFSVNGMLPGDAETRYFCVRISGSEPVTLRFSAVIHNGGEALSRALNIKVTLLGTQTVLYEGAFGEMPELTATATPESGNATDVYYEVTVTLDTSAGNELQNTSLEADFHWSAEGGATVPDHNTPTTPDKSGVPAGAIVAIVLVAVAAAGGIAFLIFVLLRRRKRGQGDE